MDALRKKYDKQNLFDVISDLPEQFLTSFASTKISIRKNTANIVFSGMGGSAWPADLLQTYLNAEGIALPVRLIVNRDYTLPASVDKSWCGFFSSYSGNTEETLSALKQAEKMGMKQIVIMAHGGQLEKIALKRGYAFVKIPDFKQPRMAYGYYIGALLKILVNSNLIKFDAKQLTADVKKIKTNQSEIEAEAQVLALSCNGQTPLIYSSALWQDIGRVWKINLNENAKTTAFSNIYPEMMHNEMVGFTNPIGKYRAIVLRDGAEDKRILKRIEILKKILPKSIPLEIVDLPKGTAGYKMIYSLWLGLYFSYYLALLYRIDPTPVVMVEKFKQLMAE